MRARLDRRVARAALVLLFLGAAASLAAAQPLGTRPRTLLVIHGHVHAFAADNGRLAWVTGSDEPRCRPAIHVLELSSGRTATVDRKTCRYPSGIVLVGDRVVWTDYHGGNTEMWGSVMTAALRDPTTRVLARSYSTCGDLLSCGFGLELGSDGRHALFSLNDQASPSQVDLVTGHYAKKLFSSSDSSVYYGPIAVAGQTVVVGSAYSACGGRPCTPPTIEIHALATGALLQTIKPATEASGFALSATRLLAWDWKGPLRINAYDIATGRKLWTRYPAGRRIDPDSGLNPVLTGHWLVAAYNEQRLFLLDLRSGRTVPLFRARGYIVGLAAVRGHVVWAEQLRDDLVHVRSLALPG